MKLKLASWGFLQVFNETEDPCSCQREDKCGADKVRPTRLAVNLRYLKVHYLLANRNLLHILLLPLLFYYALQKASDLENQGPVGAHVDKRGDRNCQGR